jgi:predicted ATPase
MIMIEEPEAHLHPEVQVKLVAQFAALTNLGVKVVLTSHNNYIFYKASNLVISGQLSPNAVAATPFTMEEHGSVGKPLVVDAYGIDDENFVETAESLFMDKAEAPASDAESDRVHDRGSSASL